MMMDAVQDPERAKHCVTDVIYRVVTDRLSRVTEMTRHV